MRISILLIVFLMATHGWAHGDDKPGPNGGFISMPGAFHVELVPMGERSLKAYLLDIDWRNPSVKDSSIEIRHGSINAKCMAKVDHFICDFPASVGLSKPGELRVNAVREKFKGNSVTYSLPLKFKMHH